MYGYMPFNSFFSYVASTQYYVFMGFLILCVFCVVDYREQKLLISYILKEWVEEAIILNLFYSVIYIRKEKKKLSYITFK